MSEGTAGSGRRRLRARRSVRPRLPPVLPSANSRPPRRMGEQREGAVLGPLRESRVPGTPPRPLTLSVSPRVRGATLETLGRRQAQLPPRVCLLVSVSLSVSVSELASASTPNPLGHLHPASPRPSSWQVRGRQTRVSVIPPLSDLGVWCGTHPPGMCSDWPRGPLPCSWGAAALLPCPSPLSPLLRFPRE